MTDRELLEAAARAAGIVIGRCRLDDPLQRDMLIEPSIRNPGQKAGAWNPLTDDGDALRLAVKLEFDLCISPIEHVAVWCLPLHDFVEEPRTPDAGAATRRAIVRAAAEIGKATAQDHRSSVPSGSNKIDPEGIGSEKLSHTETPRDAKLSE